MTETPLGGGGEFDRIRAIAAALGGRARELGNDTALVRLGDTTVALSADVSVEGVHFRREWLSFEEIGWRAAIRFAKSSRSSIRATVIVRARRTTSP